MIGEILYLVEHSLSASRLSEELQRLMKRAAVGSQEGRELVTRIEDAVSKVPDRAFRFDGRGFATLTVAGTDYAAGRFETPTIGVLRARAMAQPGTTGQGKGRCRVFVLRGGTALADVGALEAFDDGDTLFQVASQFNCLESPGAYVVPVADYFVDSTQGPRASIAAFPGTLLRHYMAPDASGNRFVQSSRGPQLNLLADVSSPEVAQVASGYLSADQVKDPGRLAEDIRIRFDSIRVGVHEGVEVVLGHNWNGPVLDPHPRISQVFTSTVAAGMYSPGVRLDVEGPWRAIARHLLKGAYVGTLLAAKTLHKRRVVLTSIGGGVFGNPHDLICEALIAALDEVEKVGGSLDVVVNIFQSQPTPFLPALRSRGGFVIDVDRSEVQRYPVPGVGESARPEPR